MSDDQDYSSWTKADLQAELDNRGLESPSNATKDELVELLEADDKVEEEVNGDAEAEESDEEKAPSTSDAASRVEGSLASETPADEHQGPHASDSPSYAFPTQGDVDVATVDPGSGEGEFMAPLAVDDWVILDGSAEEVPDELDGRRAVILAAPTEAVPVDEAGDQLITVRTRDDRNETLEIPFSAVKKVVKGGLDPSVRG